MKVGCHPVVRVAPCTAAGGIGLQATRSPSVRKAFSLLELLLVIAILVILTTLYWGPASGGRQRRWKIDCQKNLEKLYISMEIFSNEHGGRFPLADGATSSSSALAQLVPKYASDTSLFICPAQRGGAAPPTESFATARISYAYYMGRALANSQQPLLTDAQVDSLPKTPGQLAFSRNGKPPGNNHQGRGGNILYCDGHVVRSPATVSVPLETGPGVVLLNP